MTCPPADVLGRFLAGEPTDPDVGPHLRACAVCQEAAERLSDPSELRAWVNAAEPAADDADADVVARLVDVLCQAPPGPRLPAEAAPPRPAGVPQFPGRYEVEEEVGRGGMGVVYRARDAATGRTVALKVLDPGRTDAATRRRFLREVRAAARVEHENVVRLYATADPDEPLPYYVMEYVDGPSLAATLRDRRRLAPREAAGLVAQAAAGLAAAHRAGVVHRDVKPGNILVEAATGRVRLGDFGLALLTAESSDLTGDGVVAGTPTYLSPEQLRGEEPGGPGPDVYALGVTLYECLSGEPPFRGSTQRVLHQILHDDPRPPRELNDAVPRDLETVCLRAMEKDPSRRYPDADAFRDDLLRWLDGRPVVARPVGRLGRLARQARRRPGVSALVAALAAALFAGAAGVTWQWRVAAASDARSRAYLRRTLELIDAYFVKVSENQLLNVPNLQSLRKELLGGARDTYAEILRERPDDPATRGQLAEVRMRLATVVSAVGQPDEALRLLNEASAELDELIRARPADAPARARRLRCLATTGSIQLISGRLADAKASYRDALARAEAALAARPDDTVALEVAYGASHGLGRVATLEGSGPESAAAFESGLRFNDRLLRLDPNNAGYLRNTSRTNGLLAQVERGLGRVDRARSAFAAGYDATKRLVKEHPDSLDYRFALANYHRERGTELLLDALSRRGGEAAARLAESRAVVAEGLALDRELARANPQVEAYRVDSLSLLLIAVAVEQADGRVDAQRALLDEARTAAAPRAENPAVETERRLSWSQLLLYSALGRSDAGDHDGALKDLDEAASFLPDPAGLSPQNRSITTRLRTLLAGGRALALRTAGSPAEAAAELDRAATDEPGLRPLAELIRDLYRSEAGVGPSLDPARVLAAVPLLNAVTSMSPLSGAGNLLYAGFYARAAGAATGATREALESRAVLMLERAAASGYLRDPRRLAEVDRGELYARVRAREDFKALRSKLGPAGP